MSRACGLHGRRGACWGGEAVRLLGWGGGVAAQPACMHMHATAQLTSWVNACVRTACFLAADSAKLFLDTVVQVGAGREGKRVGQIMA